VSPTVLASWLTRGDRLTLLVLWRGSPGWFWRTDRGGGGGGSTGQNAFQEIREGGLTFRIDYDFTADTATILGKELSLGDTNVVMMDLVDSPAGPTMVDSRQVDPALIQPSWDAGLAVIRREPDLHPFLQCDMPMPASFDPAPPMGQALITAVCAQLRGR
jgi:hypothetical protein